MVSTLVFMLMAADPAARYDAFMKAHPTFVATTQAFYNGKSVGTGILRLNRPSKFRFDFTAPQIDYGLSSTSAGYVELDRLDKKYDEHAPLAGLRLYESRLSDATTFFPHYFFPQTVKALFGSQAPTVTAVPGGDELRLVMKSQMGDSEIRLTVDAEGQPVKFSQSSDKGTFEWRLTSFKTGTPDLANYRLEPPLGYVPFALPDLTYPLQVGEQAPLRGWRQGGKTVDLAEPQRGKTRLLAVLGPECLASKAARPTLAQLAKTIPVLIIAPGEIVDPSGTLMKQLSPPGTPMFYLVGPDEKVKNLWFGFDASKAAAWLTEVRTAATK